MNQKKLTYFNVAAMYVGAIMGAGFASGREGWQFFGVFGTKGFAGLFIAGLLFVAMGVMISYIATELNTKDMGRIIVPWNNEVLIEMVGWFLAAILYTIIISMSAAGGSFLNQQFGLHQSVGGIIIVVLVLFTVLGNFERISKVFRFIVPVLFTLDILLCLLVIFSDINQSGAVTGFKTSSLAPQWAIAAVLFTAYNMLGTVPIIAEASLNAVNRKNGIAGGGLGGVMLTVLTAFLVLTLRKDMAFTDGMDLPMLAYSERLGSLPNLIFGIILFAAIYSAATSLYYGFSTKIKESPKKKYILIIGAVIGFFCGLSGFKNVVSFLYPLEGYIGLAIMTMITINFVKLKRRKKKQNE